MYTVLSVLVYTCAVFLALNFPLYKKNILIKQSFKGYDTKNYAYSPFNDAQLIILCDVDIQQAATEGLETTIDPWTPTDLYIDASRTILNA